MENNKNNTIAELIQKIQQKQISPHSKNFFRLKLFAFYLILFSISIVSILLCSFILFDIRMSGQYDFIGLGKEGIVILFILFPWILFLLDIILALILGTLMRHMSFGYRIPGLYVITFALGIILISGYVVDSKTSFHRNMLLRADKKTLPLFGDIYRNIRRSPPVGYNIYRGVVVSEKLGLLYIDIDNMDGAGSTSSVIVDVSKDYGVDDVHMGDHVFITGKITDGNISQARIKKSSQLPLVQ